jgi:Tfp pilus assembly protein PilO
MIVQWTGLSIWHRLGLSGIVILVCLLGLHIVIWREMDQSIEMLQQEVARLDQETQGLIPKLGSLKVIEKDITELRKNLFSRVQQFPEYIDEKTFRRDVVEIAKRRSVTVRVWKPGVPLTGLQHSESSIPITIKLEGDFQGTVQFLDELGQLSWIQSIGSIVMTRRQGIEDSSLIITNIGIHGLTSLGIEHVRNLLKA